ncbi:MAG: hypothetical protein AB7S38_28855 [Vulcanimicrobiota bacterium]
MTWDPKPTRGKDLRVGDTIEVWWGSKSDHIIEMEPYTGSLADLWEHDGGARIAWLATGASMLIEPQVSYSLIARMEAP